MKKKVLTKIAITFICISLLLSAIPVAAAEKESLAEIKESTALYLYSLLEENPSYGSEWIAMDLARGGLDTSDTLLITYYENIVKTLKEKEGILSSSRYTEYAKAALAVKAMGRNPSNVGGYNLLLKLTETDNVKKQGINGPVWALNAINACGYESEAKEEYIRCILESVNRLESGGWKLSSSSECMDVDITAMVVTAISPYLDRDEVKEAVDKAIQAIKNSANEDGTFSETKGMVACADSTAQVVTAFTVLGIDCEKYVEGLLSFRKENGFEHIKGSGINNMATDQAYRALVSYERFKKGERDIFDLGDAKPPVIMIPEKTEIGLSTLSNERISAKWEAVLNADGYQISFDGKTYAVSSNSKVFKNLEPNKVYKAKVRGFRIVNGERVYGPWSDTKNIKAKYTSPAKPVISAKNIKKKSISIKWKKVSYAKGYQVAYRKKGGKYKYVYTKDVSKKVSGLKEGMTYQIKVRAYKAVSGKKKYGKWSSITSVKVKV